MNQIVVYNVNPTVCNGIYKFTHIITGTYHTLNDIGQLVCGHDGTYHIQLNIGTTVTLNTTVSVRLYVNDVSVGYNGYETYAGVYSTIKDMHIDQIIDLKKGDVVHVEVTGTPMCINGALHMLQL